MSKVHHLSAFPVETLANICSLIGSDIKNLARVDSFFLNFCRPWILRSRYNVVRDRNDCMIPRVLRDVLKDPSVIPYINRLEFWCHYVCDSVPSDDCQALIKENTDLYGDAVRRLIPEDAQDKWIEHISIFNDDALKALLILSLPNLESVDWSLHSNYNYMNDASEGAETHFFFEYLRITADNRDTRPAIGLKEISIYSAWACDTGNFLQLDDITELLTLPSLQKISLSEVRGDNEELVALPSYSSPLQTLELRSSFLNSLALQNFLSPISALKSLTCEVGKPDGNWSTGDEAPYIMLEVIESTCAQTLEVLHLAGHEYEFYDFDEQPDTLPTLRKFNNLTQFIVTAAILSQNFRFQSDLIEEDLIEEDLIEDDLIEDSPNSLPQPNLGTLMPPNLTVLEIRGCIDSVHAEDLGKALLDLLDAKESQIPEERIAKLEKIHLNVTHFSNADWESEVRLRCETLGIEFLVTIKKEMR
ncbi:hypothetical protein BP5796_13021 [Coleophoma crateriformis]|uniref:Uncharacterized protein n=1 Tax=Coleophoma crateriformis TaxID=565419 RepID=A0A3D8Q6B9_9HELO|nr:hypothetical protein BP5796_13021 [Coleophoma crateriformis]